MKSFIHARRGSADRAALEKLKQATGQSESEIVRRGLRLVAQRGSSPTAKRARPGGSSRRAIQGRAEGSVDQRQTPWRLRRSEPARRAAGYGSAGGAAVGQPTANHDRARRLFAERAPPLRCCEAVVAEARVSCCARWLPVDPPKWWPLVLAAWTRSSRVGLRITGPLSRRF